MRFSRTWGSVEPIPEGSRICSTAERIPESDLTRTLERGRAGSRRAFGAREGAGRTLQDSEVFGGAPADGSPLAIERWTGWKAGRPRLLTVNPVGLVLADREDAVSVSPKANPSRFLRILRAARRRARAGFGFPVRPRTHFQRRAGARTKARCRGGAGASPLREFPRPRPDRGRPPPAVPRRPVVAGLTSRSRRHEAVARAPRYRPPAWAIPCRSRIDRP